MQYYQANQEQLSTFPPLLPVPNLCQMSQAAFAGKKQVILNNCCPALMSGLASIDFANVQHIIFTTLVQIGVSFSLQCL